jgi:hypothetical protein
MLMVEILRFRDRFENQQVHVEVSYLALCDGCSGKDTLSGTRNGTWFNSNGRTVRFAKQVTN